MNDDDFRKRAAIGLVIGLACVLGGAYLTYDAFGTAIDAEGVEATVLSSSVSGSTPTAGDTGTSNRGFSADITYEYTYEGESYQNSNVFPEREGTANNFDNRGSAKSLADDYPEGETVTAYVDPEHPDQAHLENQVRLKSVVGYLVLVLIGAVVLVGLAYEFATSRRGEE